MHVSVRSCLTAGVATLTAGALAIAPVHVPAPQSVTVNTVRLSSAVQPLVEPVNSAAAALGLVDAAAAAVQPQAAVQPYNAASNLIDAVYSVSRYWANYMSLDLGPWLIGWLPGGYLINDQIYIWYPTFTLPVVDSFVYSFLIPVVNDPLNPAVWSNGLSAIANTAWNGVVSGVQQEINYLFSLQWFPIPLPPFPPFPFAATPTTPLASPLAATLAAPDTGGTEAEGEPAPEAAAPSRVSSGLGHSKRVARVAEEAPSVAAAAEQVAPAEPEVTDVTLTRQADRSNSKPEADKGATGSKETAKPNDTAKKSVGKSARAHRAQKSGD